MRTLLNVGPNSVEIVATLFNVGPNPHPIMPSLPNSGPHPSSDNARYAEIMPTSTIVATFVICFPNPPSDEARHEFCDSNFTLDQLYYHANFDS